MPIPEPANSITQATWLWIRTDYNDGTTIDSLDPSKYTVTFSEDGRVRIQADCNSGSSTYTIEGSRLTIQPAAVTLAFCGPASQDAVFLRDLQRVVGYTFKDEQLVLNLALDSGNMVFSPMPPVSITGGEWRVLGINNGRGGVVSVLADTEVTATFGEDGILTGNTGCNLYRSSYSIDGSAISFGPIVSTRRACLSDSANTQEQAFLSALSASTTYELVGDRLTLRNEAGATQVDMVRSANAQDAGSTSPE
jgi:heat shock protein HslJ